MGLPHIDWQRGLVRLYYLVVVFWFLYWIFWVPYEGVQSATRIASLANDPTLWSHATFQYQWLELGKEIIEKPLLSLSFLGLPPLLGYGTLRLSFFTFKWLLAGFRPRPQ